MRVIPFRLKQKNRVTLECRVLFYFFNSLYDLSYRRDDYHSIFIIRYL